MQSLVITLPFQSTLNLKVVSLHNDDVEGCCVPVEVTGANVDSTGANVDATGDGIGVYIVGRTLGFILTV